MAGRSCESVQERRTEPRLLRGGANPGSAKEGTTRAHRRGWTCGRTHAGRMRPVGRLGAGRERRQAPGRQPGLADHVDRRQHRRRPRRRPGIVPEGTNSHTFEPDPSVAELLSDGRRGLRQRAQARGARPRSSPRRTTRTAPRSWSSAHDGPAGVGVHLRLLVPEGGRQAQPAPVDRPDPAPSSTPTVVRRHVWPSATRRTPRPTHANFDAFAGQGRRARRRAARPTRPPCPRATRAAHLPRRLRLLRADATAGRSSARSSLATSRTRRPRRSPT